MSDTPRRAWFHIHLSTAVVMMFVLGFLLHLNLRPTRRSPESNTLDYGWPAGVVEMIPQKDLPKFTDLIEELEIAASHTYGPVKTRKPRVPADPAEADKLIAFDYPDAPLRIICNLIVAILFCSGTAFGCEKLFHRGEGRAPS